MHPIMQQALAPFAPKEGNSFQEQVIELLKAGDLNGASRIIQEADAMQDDRYGPTVAEILAAKRKWNDAYEAPRPAPGVIVATDTPYDETMLRQVRPDFDMEPELKRKERRAS